MCTCIENIKTSYTAVRRETSRVARKSFKNPVWAAGKTVPDIDDFLDAINLITHELNDVTQSTNDLIEVVRNNFCYITSAEAEQLLELSKPILKTMQLLHRKLLASSLYRGMQTAVGLYEDAISDFDELCHDLKTFRIDLERNEDFKETERLLSEMLRG